MSADKKGVNYLLGMAIFATIAMLFQLFGALRYIKRLPDDTFGVTLYIVTCILFAVIATVNYARWSRDKKDNAGG